MANDEDLKPWDKIKLPTDEQIARAVEIARCWGIYVSDNDPTIRAQIVIILNKDMILGYGHE